MGRTHPLATSSRNVQTPADLIRRHTKERRKLGRRRASPPPRQQPCRELWRPYLLGRWCVHIVNRHTIRDVLQYWQSEFGSIIERSTAPTCGGTKWVTFARYGRDPE